MMKIVISSLLRLGLAAGAAVQSLESRTGFQTLHLTFHGGPAEYSMTIPADGNIYTTGNNIAVNIIDAPDYNALAQCTFYTRGEQKLANSITNQGIQQIIMGPPQPITGVSCYGICIGKYGNCYDTDEKYLGPCCNGYCAADKCRPWFDPF